MTSIPYERCSFNSSFHVEVIKVPTMQDLVGDTPSTQIVNSYLQSVVKDLSINGFSVIEFQNISYEDMPLLKKIFGSIAPHQKHDSEGRLMVDPDLPTSIGVANVEESHKSHTDETYMPNPSKIIALLCERAATTGGRSTMVSGKAMYDFVKKTYPDKLDALFLKNALVVARSLVGVGWKEERDNLAIFSHQTDGRIRMRFRWSDSYVREVQPEVKEAWLALCDFVDHKDNSLEYKLKENQLLLIDNCGMVHGRTPYSKGDKRRLWRMNFYNDGVLKDKILLGLDG